MAGGWAQAARLPATEALAWGDRYLRKERWSAHAQSLQIWASTLPAYVHGGTPPEAPTPPE